MRRFRVGVGSGRRRLVKPFLPLPDITVERRVRDRGRRLYRLYLGHHLDLLQILFLLRLRLISGIMKDKDKHESQITNTVLPRSRYPFQRDLNHLRRFRGKGLRSL